MTPYFVGRNQELADLHRNVGVGKIGLVTAVHGLGGQGKTELSIAYARGYADCYSLGIWSLAAEGKTALLPLIGELAWAVEFGFTPSDAERNDADKLGLRGAQGTGPGAEAANQADPDRAPSALLLLDNVSETELFSAAQLSQLPKVDWLRLIATTRLDPKRMDPLGKQIGTVIVDSLDPDNAHAVDRGSSARRQVSKAQDETDAKLIVRELDGFTLAIEQVAVFLGLSAQTSQPISPGDYLKRLEADGLPSTDDLVEGDGAQQMEHQEKQLGPVLRSMLADLPAAGLTLLQFAALLPPDVIPWPWLRELTLQQHPELRNAKPGYPDPWVMLRRQIEGFRFLTPGDNQHTARMHRLIAAHLRQSSPQNGQNRTLLHHQSALCEYLAKHARGIYKSQSAPNIWELDALVVALPYLLNEKSTRDLIVGAMALSKKVLAYLNIPSAETLLTVTHILIQRLADSDPGNNQWHATSPSRSTSWAIWRWHRGTLSKPNADSLSPTASASVWPTLIPATPSGNATSRSRSTIWAIWRWRGGTCPRPNADLPTATASSSVWPTPTLATPVGNATSPSHSRGWEIWR